MTPYRDSWEHLQDELVRLDHLLAGAVTTSRERRRHDPLEQLRGLVVSDEEVDTLLAASNRQPAPSTDPKLAELTRAIDRRVTASLERGVPLTLPELARRFQLGRFEARVLVLGLAPELDRKYEKLYAYLHDDVTRKMPTVGLALELAGEGADAIGRRAAFAGDAPLLSHRLIEVGTAGEDNSLPLISRPLKLDDRIAALLLGHGRLDARLTGLVRQIDPAGVPSPTGPARQIGHRLDELTAALLDGRVEDRKQLVVHLRGRYGSGRLALASASAARLGKPLLVADAERLLASPASSGRSAREIVERLAREAYLQSAVLAVERFDLLLGTDASARALLGELTAGLGRYGQISFLLGEERWRPRPRPEGALWVPLRIERADESVRLELWRDGLRAHRNTETAEESHLGRIASEFRFTPGQVRDALAGARDLAVWRRGAGGAIEVDDVTDACRAQATPELARLARRVETSCGWDDLILPDDPLRHLHELCDQARRRHIVFGSWGFGDKLSYGRGLAALFSGPPGTGKTHAAAIIARDLGLDLFKIDLSQVVSKYIGETEKNLDRIFSAAEDANAILFFDEADALFGKRSEVRDSHDRYANVEVSYLLQKMEECEGFTILATNLRQHLDDAFLRRLAVVVEFPFPGAGERERIWRITLPEQAPLGEDVDLGELARQVRLAGGNIKNMSLTAAFYAAGDGQVIRMPHLWRAARREFQKLGRTWNEQAVAGVVGDPAVAAPSANGTGSSIGGAA